MFYIEEKRMFGFILEMGYFTMAENRKYFWKTFYITAPMEISGTFELGNKHFNAAAVRGCLTVFGVVFIFGNISCSSFQKGCPYITPSEAICKNDVSQGIFHTNVSPSIVLNVLCVHFALLVNVARKAVLFFQRILTIIM
jgi:hypothetical protein